MEIIQAGSRPTSRGPKESFTGTVWQDPIITPQAPMRIVCSRVAFEPSARTAWHTHPLGQTLYVTEGVGRFQSKVDRSTDPARRCRVDSPGEKHWHGASPRPTGMVHLAMQESLDGTHVTWLEQVTDAEFHKKVG